MASLTDGERRCLDIVHDILSAGRQPSILEVSRLMNITKGGANHHMRALREKGALRGPRVVGQWALTSVGKKVVARSRDTV